MPHASLLLIQNIVAWWWYEPEQVLIQLRIALGIAKAEPGNLAKLVDHFQTGQVILSKTQGDTGKLAIFIFW